MPNLKIKFVNVVNIMTLANPSSTSEGLTDKEFNEIFNLQVPIIFAFHGYPSMIHRLIYNRSCHANFHIHGFNEEGTTTTPFDMLVLNKLDRFNLVKNAILRLKNIKNEATIIADMDHKLYRHKNYIVEKGDDLPEVKNFIWD